MARSVEHMIGHVVVGVIDFVAILEGTGPLGFAQNLIVKVDAKLVVSLFVDLFFVIQSHAVVGFAAIIRRSLITVGKGDELFVFSTLHLMQIDVRVSGVVGLAPLSAEIGTEVNRLPGLHVYYAIAKPIFIDLVSILVDPEVVLNDLLSFEQVYLCSQFVFVRI